MSWAKYRLCVKTFAAVKQAQQGDEVSPGKEINAKAQSIKARSERGKC